MYNNLCIVPKNPIKHYSHVYILLTVYLIVHVDMSKSMYLYVLIEI